MHDVLKFQNNRLNKSDQNNRDSDFFFFSNRAALEESRADLFAKLCEQRKAVGLHGLHRRRW